MKEEFPPVALLKVRKLLFSFWLSYSSLFFWVFSLSTSSNLSLI